jgi:ubiquinone/menaquinone biosynthesis C-methylase UbiE
MPGLFKTIRQLTSKGGIEGWFAEKFNKFGKEVMIDEYKKTVNKVKKQLKKGEILEIGPGPGYLSIELSKIDGYHIVGLDISKTMIEIANRNAKESGSSIQFKLGDASNIPYHDNTFDFIISGGSLHHWKEPIKVLNEIYRVLKRDRKALICDGRRDASKEEIIKMLKKIDSFIMRWGLKKTIKESYTKEKVVELLSRTKFNGGEIKENPLELEIWLKK